MCTSLEIVVWVLELNILVIQSQIHLYWYFIWREYPHDVLLEAWNKTNLVTRESLLTDSTCKHESKAPLMFITTYSSANPNFRELISRHWSYLGRSSATRELCNQDIMVTYRKPPSLKDMLVRAKFHNQRQKLPRAAQDPTPVNIAQGCPNQGR